MTEQRPYLRAQPSDWWARPPYLAYTLRELTGVAVAFYGAILFCGLVCLWLGPNSFNAFVQALASPWSFVLHLVLLAAVIWHVVTWFQILPKTMPRLVLGGAAVPQKRITLVATVFGVCCSLALVALALIGAAP
jgi:fumarate reductase subunit C